VDAHVHLYDCFRLSAFLTAAARNFESAADRLGCGDSYIGVLLLTETSRDHWFERLLEKNPPTTGADVSKGQAWSVQRTQEDNSVYAVKGEKHGIFIIAGRQIATREGLEVLSIGKKDPIADNQSLAETIEKVRLTGGLPVLPWGPGKWTGARGKIILEFVNNPDYVDTFLGDNGNRPFFWPYPAILRSAAKQGRKILPGSDPLPFASEENRPGSYGLYTKGRLSNDHPAQDLVGILKSARRHVSPFGQRETLWRFARNQVGMQIKKHITNQKVGRS
jgi:hypothetical protein